MVIHALLCFVFSILPQISHGKDCDCTTTSRRAFSRSIFVCVRWIFLKPEKGKDSYGYLSENSRAVMDRC
jgi:hypothetical protein